MSEGELLDPARLVKHTPTTLNSLSRLRKFQREKEFLPKWEEFWKVSIAVYRDPCELDELSCSPSPNEAGKHNSPAHASPRLHETFHKFQDIITTNGKRQQKHRSRSAGTPVEQKI